MREFLLYQEFVSNGRGSSRFKAQSSKQVPGSRTQAPKRAGARVWNFAFGASLEL
jgi:hypothetical protein